MYDLEVSTSQVFAKYSWDIEWIFCQSLIRKTETILSVSKKGNLTQGIGQGGGRRLGSTWDMRQRQTLATVGNSNIRRAPGTMQGGDVPRAPKLEPSNSKDCWAEVWTHGGRSHLKEAKPQWRCSCFRNATKSRVQRKNFLASSFPPQIFCQYLQLDKPNWKPETKQRWEIDVPQREDKRNVVSGSESIWTSDCPGWFWPWIFHSRAL